MLCFFTYDYALGIAQQKFGYNTILQDLSQHEARTAEANFPPESGGASNVGHVHEIACRELDLNSCYLEDGSKPGRNLDSR